MRARHLLLALVALTISARLAQAGDADGFSEHPHTRARLIASHDALSAGESTTLALHLVLDEHWHSYWRNPGDSGAAPLLTVTAPPGVSVSEARYPLPARFDTPPLITFGYEREVMYLFEARLTDGAAAGPARISLAAEWLVCKVECIPAIGEFEITLRTAGDRAPTPHAPAIAAFERRLPVAAESVGLITAATARAGSGNGVVLEVAGARGVTPTDFLPADGTGALKLALPARSSPAPGMHHLEIEASPGSRVDRLQGLLVLVPDASGDPVSVDVDVPVGQLATPASPATAPPPPLARILAFAFLGGLLLNLMPCVFPLISIKLFGILQHAHGNAATVRAHCMAYVAGVVASFLAFGGLLVALRAGGTSLGWGFQLQSPGFLVALCFVFALMAFGFLGLIEVNLPLGSTGARLLSKEGAAGQFLTGVLSTVVASPCTAPFMGFAMGAAISQSTGVILATFTALGLGLGAPYLAFMVSPGVLKLLPRPGAWMETLRQLMAFPLLATCLWLLWVLGQVAALDAVIVTLAGLLVVALGIWVNRRVGRLWPAVGAFAVALGAALYLVAGVAEKPRTDAPAADGIAWQSFTPAGLAASRTTDKPVFVDFTADWCITCKVNERVTFRDREVQDFVARHGVVMIKADWTRRDAAITALLAEYDRIGVPLYLLWAPGSRTAHVLPEVLTPTTFMNELRAQLALNH